MRNILLFPFLQSVGRSEKPNGNRFADFLNLLPLQRGYRQLISKGNQVFNYVRNKNIFNYSNNLSTVGIPIRLQRNVDWQSHCGNHNYEFKKVTAFVLKDSSGVEIIPPERTLVNKPGLGNFVIIHFLWKPFSQSR